MDGINAALSFVGLDPAMFGVAIAAGIALRFARGTIRGFTSGWSYLSALVIAIAFGALDVAADGKVNVDDGKAVMALLASILIVQAGAAALANKVPFLPQDNEWAKDQPVTKP